MEKTAADMTRDPFQKRLIAAIAVVVVVWLAIIACGRVLRQAVDDEGAHTPSQWTSR